MNRVEELIERLCPDGVEYKRLGFVFKRVKGTPITAALMKQIATPNGEIRIFAGGKTIIDADEASIPNANITRVPAVLVQSRGVIDFIYYDKPFTFKNEMWAYTCDNKIQLKYLYYVLKNNLEYFRGAASRMGSLPQISVSVTDDFKIPLPPLEVQNEIVNILDNFSKLEAELETELEARKQQYEYYKELVFKKYITEDTQYLPLNEIADVRDGTHASPKQSSAGKYLITSKNIKKGTINFDGAYLISIDDFNEINQRSKVNKWDLLFTMIGTVGEIGIVSDEPDYAIKNVGLIKTGNERLAKFLKYYLNTTICKEYVNENRSKGTQVFLSLGKLRKIPIPVLTEEEQARIVSILDRFDKLCNDLTEGLPAEIEARRKQYEYYRDLLLTFKPKETRADGVADA